MKLSGIVHAVGEIKTYGAKGFQKRVVVIEQENGRWSNYIPVELTGDNCVLADDLQVGDEVEVGGNLTGRKWQKDPSAEVQYFLGFEAREVSVTGAAGPREASVASEETYVAPAAAYDDDIPF